MNTTNISPRNGHGCRLISLLRWVRVTRSNCVVQRKEMRILKFGIRFALLGMLLNLYYVAQTPKFNGSAATSPTKLEQMPTSLEVRYARSATPPHLPDGATTYVLDASQGTSKDMRKIAGLTSYPRSGMLRVRCLSKRDKANNCNGESPRRCRCRAIGVGTTSCLHSSPARCAC
jgi:hypothetical protein